MYGGYYDIVWLDPDGRERVNSSGNTNRQRTFATAKRLVETGEAIWSEVRTDANSSLPVEVLIRFPRPMAAKKTAAQLNRDIAEVLAKPPRRSHATTKAPVTENEWQQIVGALGREAALARRVGNPGAAEKWTRYAAGRPETLTSDDWFFLSQAVRHGMRDAKRTGEDPAEWEALYKKVQALS
jgi:hypothetical protein